MKESWINFLNEVKNEIYKISNFNDTVCFRGHAESNWDLHPSLLVQKAKKKLSDETISNYENNLFFDFVTNAGTLINGNNSDWEVLFLMRHHGVPTRVLDWTESFGTALFFALNGGGTSPTIWIMDPYKLNKISYVAETIPNPLKDLKFSYTEAYLDKSVKPFEKPIAIIPPRTSVRSFAQKGLFTLQGSDYRPLNHIPELQSCIKRFELPSDAIDDANKFLMLAGINHYSIFPDLDGLSKHIVSSVFD